MIYTGDCVEVMRTLPDVSVDAVVTDPPYGLEFMGRDWDSFKASGVFAGGGRSGITEGRGTPNLNGPRFTAGHPYQAWCTEWAIEAFRVLKPGGYLLAFGGTRTVHRLASAIEDAGFEIRDELVWIYASGFPKSLDVSKALDKVAGAEREVTGYRPVAYPDSDTWGIPNRNSTGDSNEPTSYSRPGINQGGVKPVTAPATDLARKWEGWGTALKPAHEPIVMARKPLQGTVAANVTRWGTGALNIDGTRITAPNGDRQDYGLDGDEAAGIGYHGLEGRTAYERPAAGRWPSNVLLSDPELFDRQNPYVIGSGAMSEPPGGLGRQDNYPPGSFGGSIQGPLYFDGGGYSRFFIVPKADRAERERGTVSVDGARGNHHPTVKPVDLMRHLVRLVTPPGGTVLDPFLGSGSTAIACELEGFPWVGIEKEPEYVAIAEARLNGIQKGLGLR